MNWLGAFLLSLVAGLVVLGSSPARAVRALDESVANDVSTITELVFVLQSGQHTFWTENISSMGRGCSGDPIMHVIASDNSIVQSNDDCNIGGVTSGANSCVRITNPTANKLYRVVVHAYATCTAAIGTVRATGPGLNFTDTQREFGGGVYFSSIDGIGGRPMTSWRSFDPSTISLPGPTTERCSSALRRARAVTIRRA